MDNYNQATILKVDNSVMGDMEKYLWFIATKKAMH